MIEELILGFIAATIPASPTEKPKTNSVKFSTVCEAGAQYVGDLDDPIHPFLNLTQRANIGRVSGSATGEYEFGKGAGPSLTFLATYDAYKPSSDKALSVVLGAKEAVTFKDGELKQAQLMPQVGLTGRFGKVSGTGRVRMHIKPGSDPSYSFAAGATYSPTKRLGISGTGFFPLGKTPTFRVGASYKIKG